MTYEELFDCVEKGYTTRKISEVFNISQSTTMYWLSKHKLKTKKNETNKRVCPMCKVEKDKSEFYAKNGKPGNSPYCKECSGKQATERTHKLKQDCVDYKGGKCERCGYDKYVGALDFHHIDPTKKDFSISTLRTYKFNDRIKEELDKCILVCRNCHAEIHYESSCGVTG